MKPEDRIEEQKAEAAEKTTAFHDMRLLAIDRGKMLTDKAKRIEELEAALERVRALPVYNYGTVSTTGYYTSRAAVDYEDLKAAIKGDENGK